MVESIYINSGRGCINCSGIWARGTPRKSPRPSPSESARSKPSCRQNPEAGLAAFTVPGQAKAVWRHDRSGPQGAGRHRHDGKVRPARDRNGAVRLSAAHDRPLQLARTPRSPRRNTCSRSPRSSNARRSRCSSGSAPHSSAPASPRTKLIQQLSDANPHRPPQHRPDPHHQAQLAAAPRRQHHRLPVPRACLPDCLVDSRSMRIL